MRAAPKGIPKENVILEKENTDIRWKQRFQNFEKAIHYLEHGASIEQTDLIQKARIIQFFEMSYKLAWKTIKDYMEAQGFTDINSPRSAIKKAYEVGLIVNGREWLEMINARNQTAHVYDEDQAKEIDHLIRRKFLPLFVELSETLKNK
jgi:nucleotidyltransferase substrate binding protein (TIGR01987 family)